MSDRILWTVAGLVGFSFFSGVTMLAVSAVVDMVSHLRETHSLVTAGFLLVMLPLCVAVVVLGALFLASAVQAALWGPS